MQITNWSLDTVIHVVEVVVMLGVGGYVRSINRLVSLFHDYPPHRHVPGGRILYPNDYQPSEMGKLNGDAKP